MMGPVKPMARSSRTVVGPSITGISQSRNTMSKGLACCWDSSISLRVDYMDGEAGVEWNTVVTHEEREKGGLRRARCSILQSV